MAEDTHYTSPHFWVMQRGTLKQVATGLPAYQLFRTEWGQPEEELLLSLKKACAQRRESLLHVQKQFAKAKDFESAKLIKEEANELQRLQRACALFLGHVMTQPPGDSLFKPVEHWPHELRPECSRVDNALDCPQAAAALHAYIAMDQWHAPA